LAPWKWLMGTNVLLSFTPLARSAPLSSSRKDDRHERQSPANPLNRLAAMGTYLVRRVTELALLGIASVSCSPGPSENSPTPWHPPWPCELSHPELGARGGCACQSTALAPDATIVDRCTVEMVAAPGAICCGMENTCFCAAPSCQVYTVGNVCRCDLGLSGLNPVEIQSCTGMGTRCCGDHFGSCFCDNDPLGGPTCEIPVPTCSEATVQVKCPTGYNPVAVCQ